VSTALLAGRAANWPHRTRAAATTNRLQFKPNRTEPNRTQWPPAALHRRLLEQVGQMRAELPPVCRLTAANTHANRPTQNHRSLAQLEEKLLRLVSERSIAKLAPILADPLLKLEEVSQLSRSPAEPLLASAPIKVSAETIRGRPILGPQSRRIPADRFPLAIQSWRSHLSRPNSPADQWAPLSALNRHARRTGDTVAGQRGRNSAGRTLQQNPAALLSPPAGLLIGGRVHSGAA